MIFRFMQIYRFSKRVTKDSIPVYAAQASFFIVLAFFPFLMMLLSMIQVFFPSSRETLVEAVESIFPETLHAFFTSILGEIYSKATGTLFSITALVALWSSSKGIMAVEKGLNQVYQTPRTGYIRFRLISLVYTVIFILIILSSLLLLVFGNRIQLFLEAHIPLIARISSYIISVRALLSIVILVLFFMSLYAFFPGRLLSWKAQLPGAMFSTAGWMLFSYGFSIYIDYFSNYSYMYGSLTAIVLMMLWLYICMNILLVGAEINVVMKEGEI